MENLPGYLEPDVDGDVLMIIIINGSLGVGKTAASWALLSKLDKAVMLDMDYLAAIHSFSVFDEDDLQYVSQTVGHLMQFHHGNGYEHFVLNYVLEQKEALDQLVELCALPNQPVHVFFLHCTTEKQAERIIKRNNDSVEWELKRCLELNAIQEAAAKNGCLGELIDTSEMDPAAVADYICKVISSQN